MGGREASFAFIFLIISYHFLPYIYLIFHASKASFTCSLYSNATTSHASFFFHFYLIIFFCTIFVDFIHSLSPFPLFIVLLTPTTNLSRFPRQLLLPASNVVMEEVNGIYLPSPLSFMDSIFVSTT